MTEFEEIKQWIEDLANGHKPATESEGLCNNLYDMFDMNLRSSYFTGWCGFSGDPLYPIKDPGLYNESSALLDYEIKAENGDGQWVGTYGDERRKFCKWVAGNMTEEWLRR